MKKFKLYLWIYFSLLLMLTLSVKVGVAQNTRGIDIKLDTISPVIDGVFDEWADVATQSLDTIMSGETDSTDLSGRFKVLWDADNLYLYVNVTDQVLVGDHAQAWNNDNVEIAIDGNGDRSYNMFWQPQASDMKFTVVYGADLETIIEGTLNGAAHDLTGVEISQTVTTGGWAFEMKIPFAAISGDITFGHMSNIVMEIAVGDNDLGSTGSRESQISWSGKTNLNNDPFGFGTIALVNNPTTTKALEVNVTDAAFTIDGDFTDWADVSENAMSVVGNGAASIVDSLDFVPTFKVVADADNLYLMVNIIDQLLVADHAQAWNNDNVEIAIDGNGDRSYNMFWQPQASDMKITVVQGADVAAIIAGTLNGSAHDLTGVEIGQTVTTGGWAFEMKIPFAAISADITFGHLSNIVMELAAGDNDIGATGKRESILTWSGTTNTNNNPAGFGAVTLLFPQTSFSGDAIYGDAANYTTPFDAANWEVTEVAGDLRYILNNTAISPHHPSGNPWFDPDGPTGPLGNGAESALAELSVVTGTTFGDFEMTLDVAKPEFENANGYYDLAIVFGYIDENNYNYINLNGNVAASSNTVAVVVDGKGVRGKHTIDWTVPLDLILSDNDFHSVKVVREDSTIRCYYDGIKVLDFTDTAYALEGAMGVGSWNDAGYFDNIEVDTVTVSGLNNIVSTTIGTLEGTKIKEVGSVTAADLIAALTLSANATAKIVDETNGEVFDTTYVSDIMKVSVTAENGDVKDYIIEVGSLFVCNLELINVFAPITIDSLGVLSTETGTEVALILGALKCDDTSTEKVVDANGDEVAGDVLWDETYRYVITGDCGDTKEYSVKLVPPTYPVITINKVTNNNPVIIDAWFTEWADISGKYDLLVPQDATAGLPDASDLSAYFKATWDNQFLYVYINVTDDVINTSGANPWDNDGFELPLIMASDIPGRSGWNPFWQPETQHGNQKLMYVYGNTITQMTTQGANTGPGMRDYSGGILEMWNKEDGTAGYEIEMQLPWTALNGINNPNPVVIEPGAIFSMNLAVNDNDGAGRDNIIFWTVNSTNSKGAEYGKLVLSDGTTGINDFSSLHFDVYPNPVADHLIISGDKEIREISIFNMNGQMVRNLQPTGSSQISVATNDLYSGMYMLRITSIDGNVANSKFIKK